MYRRNLEAVVLEAMADTPVVYLSGPRQSGKTTLVQQLAEGPHPARYLTFDDAAVVAAAQGDPQGFIGGLDGAVVLDEVQRVPALFPAIKLAVDRDRRPGRFLLTGSADVMLLPAVAESLVGRIEILTLRPLSQGELSGRREGFIDALFAARSLPGTSETTDREELWTRVAAGGYPEVLTRSQSRRRRAWFSAYVTTILQRDVRDLAAIDGLTELPRLLALLAARTGGLLNFSELSRASGIPQTTVKRYLTLLEATFLLQPLPAWSANLGKRLVKSPKVYLNDTGLLAHLVGADRSRLAREPRLAGTFLESFVLQELAKQCSWSQTRPSLYHFRTQTGLEVDFLLEDSAGRCAAVEVKASQSLGPGDFRGLRQLRESLGDRLLRGVLLYLGSEAVPFGENLLVLPVEALWASPNEAE